MLWVNHQELRCVLITNFHFHGHTSTRTHMQRFQLHLLSSDGMLMNQRMNSTRIGIHLTWERTIFHWFSIASMYGIFTYMFRTNPPNVGEYTIHGWHGLMFLARLTVMQLVDWQGRFHTKDWDGEMSKISGDSIIEFANCVCVCDDTLQKWNKSLRQFEGSRGVYLYRSRSLT